MGIGECVRVIVTDFEYVGDAEYVTLTVEHLVNGCVVAIPVTERDVVGDFVKGNVVGIPEAVPVMLLVRETVTETVGVGVKGKVVGIGERVRVIVTDFEYVGDAEYVIDGVGEPVNACVVAGGERDSVTVSDFEYVVLIE